MVDGLSLAWLVDDDDAASLAGLHHFAGYLLTMVRPAPSASLPAPPPLPAAHRAVSRPSFAEPRPRSGADATVGALTSS